MLLATNLKITLKSVLRKKAFYTLHVLGLAGALACFLLLYIYINWEQGYDKHFKSHQQIYRVYMEGRLGDDELAMATLPTSLGPTLKELYPEVLHSVRISKHPAKNIHSEHRTFNTQQIIYADSSFFEVFSIPLKRGTRKEVLVNPFSVVISESIAKTIYDKDELVSGTAQISIGSKSQLYDVVGVYQDFPGNTHFHPDIIISMNSLERSKKESWVEWDYYTYLLLNDSDDSFGLEQKLNSEIFNKYYGPALEKEMGLSKSEIFTGSNYAHFLLQPLDDIHLHSNLKSELEANGNIVYVRSFFLLGIFVLIVAVLNFLNFSTVLYTSRSKEVGISKVLGATKEQLAIKFLQESLIIVFIAVLMALAMGAVLLPVFNDIVNQSFEIFSIFNLNTLGVCLALIVIVGIFAGSYPAFYLSSIKPVETLKNMVTGPRNKTLRTGTVVFQLFSAFILITGTIVIYKQLQFVGSKNLGFRKDQLIVVVNDNLKRGEVADFKLKLTQFPSITSVTVSSFLPIRQDENTITNVFTERNRNSVKAINWWTIDENYIPTFEIKIKAGRNFEKENDNHQASIILNETAIKQLGVSDPFKERIGIVGEDANDIKWYDVIGVVKDFHFNSLHEEIQPLALVMGESNSAFTIKINSELSTTLNIIEDNWKIASDNEPFNFYFIDTKVEQMYFEDIRLGRAFLFFGGLSIITAALALYGFAAHTAQSMAKEICIRKVLGASPLIILRMMYVNITYMVLIAVALSIPLLILFINGWLDNFAYKASIGISVYFVSSVAIFLLAFLSVSYHVIKAANGNPIKWLKS